MFLGRLSSFVLVFLLTNSKEPNYNLLEEKIRIYYQGVYTLKKDEFLSSLKNPLILITGLNSLIV